MPSWNVHLFHAEQLLDDKKASELGIHDENAFLFGNVVPDIYVGFLVAHTSKHIDYRTTHFADAAYIPLPRADAFWESYIEGRPNASDLELGAWAHLVCDKLYNSRARIVFAEQGKSPGEDLRIAKQSDFDCFGRTLELKRQVYVNPELLAQCASFGQYEIAEPDVYKSVAVIDEVIAKNAQDSRTFDELSYEVLSPQFFEQTAKEAHEMLVEHLSWRAKHLY